MSGDNTREYMAATGRLRQAEQEEAGPSDALSKVEVGVTNGMTIAREAHLDHILNEAHNRLDAKYRKGQAEHGGNLWDVPTLALVDNAIDEAIDQLTYLITIREKLVGRE